MRKLRLTLASLAVVTLATIVAAVALAAPGAVGRAASPSAGAATAVYCPAGERKARQNALAKYKKTMAKVRAAYFKKVKVKKKRAQFVQKQQAQLKALQRLLDQCKDE